MPALPPPPATDRLRFSGEVPVPTRLAACKEFLKVETAALRAHHEAGATGLATTHHRAALIDVLPGAVELMLRDRRGRLSEDAETASATLAISAFVGRTGS